MAAVASAVNYRVADSKRLALQPHRFRFDIDHCTSIGSFSRFVFLHDRICNNRNEITPSLLTRKKIDKIGSAQSFINDFHVFTQIHQYFDINLQTRLYFHSIFSSAMREAISSQYCEFLM